MLSNQALPESPDLAEEMHYIEIETRAILDAVMELGGGDVTIGTAKALESGVLDCPFSSWAPLANKVVPARDAKGAIRFRNHGGLPLPPSAVEFHQSRLKSLAGKPLDWERAVAEIFPVTEGQSIDG